MYSCKKESTKQFFQIATSLKKGSATEVVTLKTYIRTQILLKRILPYIFYHVLLDANALTKDAI